MLTPLQSVQIAYLYRCGRDACTERASSLLHRWGVYPSVILDQAREEGALAWVHEHAEGLPAVRHDLHVLLDTTNSFRRRIASLANVLEKVLTCRNVARQALRSTNPHIALWLQEGIETSSLLPLAQMVPGTTLARAIHFAEARFLTVSQMDEAKHKFASTQLQFPPEISGRVAAFGRNIPDWTLAEDGRQPEGDIHVTVKYGLHAADPEKMKEVLRPYGPVRVRLGLVTCFESEKHDVVKIDLEGKELHDLNALVKSMFPCTDTYPTYHPHCTIAYVKPHEGRKWKGMTTFLGEEYALDLFTLSNQEGQRWEFRLGQIA